MSPSDEVYFPAEYKQFPFAEGDLLVSPRSAGSYAVNKILKIDRIVVKAGESISMPGTSFTAPCEDWLLIVSMALGKSEFTSFEQARNAALSGTWQRGVGHAPLRPPGAVEGQTRVGSVPVTDDELECYQLWKEAFDQGEAGVF